MMIRAAHFLLWCAMSTTAAAQDQGSFGRVIRIDQNAFAPSAGLITFSEMGLGTENPVYKPSVYGAGADGVTVSFGGYFEGQTIAEFGQCPAGASRTGCVAGLPLSPLALSRRAPFTYILDDGSNPRSPALSGSPRFNGPVTALFDRDVAGVGLAGGFFDARRTTAITVFDRQGRQIGGVTNISTGMEFLALVTEDGKERIAGVQFSLIGPEPAGFAIDDLNFAFSGQLNREQIPALADVLRRPDPVAKDARPANGVPPRAGGLADAFRSPPDVKTPVERAADPVLAPPAKPAGGLTDLFKKP